MYRPLRSFQATIGPTLCYVLKLNDTPSAPHGVSVMQIRFRSYTLNVDA